MASRFYSWALPSAILTTTPPPNTHFTLLLKED